MRIKFRILPALGAFSIAALLSTWVAMFWWSSGEVFQPFDKPRSVEQTRRIADAYMDRFMNTTQAQEGWRLVLFSSSTNGGHRYRYNYIDERKDVRCIDVIVDAGRDYSNGFEVDCQ